jgi:hypothetical protein
VGAENCVTSCDLRILVDQAAEPIPAQNPDVRALMGGCEPPALGILSQRSVRPVTVVVIGVLAEDQPQVPLVRDSAFRIRDLRQLPPQRRRPLWDRGWSGLLPRPHRHRSWALLYVLLSIDPSLREK